MMCRRNHQLRGFSLIEVVIASGIFAVVALIGTTTLVSINRVESITKTLRGRQQAVRYTLETISRDIRWAKAISINDASNQITITAEDDSTITYSYNLGEKKIYVSKNSTRSPLTANDVDVTSFSVADPYGENNHARIEITVMPKGETDEKWGLSAFTSATVRGYGGSR